jgi:hypothetical protein
MIWMRGPIGMREDTSEKYHDVGDEDEAMYRTIMATGVQAMCINKPDLLVEMIGRRADKLEIPSIAGGNDSNSPPYRA